MWPRQVIQHSRHSQHKPRLWHGLCQDTVRGSEIQRSPVEGKVVYPIIYKVLYITSQVVQDFLPSTLPPMPNIGQLHVFNCNKVLGKKGCLAPLWLAGDGIHFLPNSFWKPPKKARWVKGWITSEWFCARIFRSNRGKNMWTLVCYINFFFQRFEWMKKAGEHETT